MLVPVEPFQHFHSTELQKQKNPHPTHDEWCCLWLRTIAKWIAKQHHLREMKNVGAVDILSAHEVCEYCFIFASSINEIFKREGRKVFWFDSIWGSSTSCFSLRFVCQKRKEVENANFTQVHIITEIGIWESFVVKNKRMRRD